jgi:hypothetical protein
MRLLNAIFKFWLLRFVLAGTFFFADGASALATVGDGGGDGSGGAGGGGEGGGGGDDELSGSGDGVSGDEGDGAESGESGADGADGEADPNALVALADGRKIPAKYKELFEQDKDLRSIYFANQALKKVFPGGVKEAIGLARQLEEFGGVEGVERLQSDLSAYTKDAEAFNSGDPKWIENSFKENADLSLKHFTNALGYVSENHPEHYDHLMAKVIVNDLDNLPVREIHSILAGLKDNPEAQKAAKALASYYNSRSEIAKKVPEKQIDPQQRKLDEQKAQLTEREQKVRNQTINAEAHPYLVRTMEGAVTAAAKAAGFDLAKIAKDQPNRYGRFLKDVRSAVHNEVLNDAKWLDVYSNALASGDTAKCVRMLNKRHDQAVKGTETKPGVAAQIFTEWFGTGKAGARRTDKGQGGNGTQDRPRTFGKETPTLVNALPPAKDINYSDPLTDKWNGIYRLKTGKLIQVKRP